MRAVYTDTLNATNADQHVECYVRGLHWIDALYFTVVTASTVGYGDVTPQSAWGKVFSILYIPVAVVVMSKAVMTLALIPSDYRRLKLEEYVLDQFGDELSASDFTDLKVRSTVVLRHCLPSCFHRRNRAV
eukprot:SAG22_NODE_1304_length_4796_cov_4.746914_4_plen_131_part_00